MKFVVRNMMKRAFAFSLISMASLSLFSQNMAPGVMFNKVKHDFGKVKEENLEVTTQFIYVNVNTVPVEIVKVETSCGCTKPKYPQGPVQPGDTGIITAIFETRGKSGDFHKHLFVHFKHSETYQTLEIMGNVVPAANLSKKPAHFNTTYANLAFTNSMVNFPMILNTAIDTTYISAYNYQGYPIKIHQINGIPDFLKVNVGDSVIKPNDSLQLMFIADGSKLRTVGSSFARVELLTDDPVFVSKFLHVHTNLKYDYSGLSSKELKMAPKCVLENRGHVDFGEKSAGAKISKTLNIKNEGKTDLNILAVVPNCSCVTYRLGKKVVAPGETVQIELIYDTINKIEAEHTNYITVYTNDPKNQELKIKVTIKIL